MPTFCDLIYIVLATINCWNYHNTLTGNLKFKVKELFLLFILCDNSICESCKVSKKLNFSWHFPINILNKKEFVPKLN